MDKFIGKWKLESSDNFDGYMEAVGVGFMLRKVASTLKPDLIFEKGDDDDTFVMKTVSTFKSTEIKFKLGEEFDEETADGRKMKTTMTIAENKLTQAQKGAVDTTLVREITADDTLTLVCTAPGKDGDITSTRVYKKSS